MNTRMVAFLSALLTLAAPFVVSGQEALTETFDGAFTFNYPDGWFMQDQGGYVLLTNEESLLADSAARLRKDDVFIVFAGPEALTEMGLNANASPQVALLTFLSVSEVQAGSPLR